MNPLMHILLPCLFYRLDANDALGISPSAQFSITDALQGNQGFLPALRPFQGVQKKTLLVTLKTLNHPNAELILRFLAASGFPVKTWRGEGVLGELPQTHGEWQENIWPVDFNRLGNGKDWVSLERKNHLSVDQVVLLEGQLLEKIVSVVKLSHPTVFQVIMSDHASYHNALLSLYPALEAPVLQSAASNLPSQEINDTPFFAAVRANNVSEVIRLLTEEKEDINQTNDKEATALHIAAQEGFVALAEILITRGANLHALCIEQYTPLHIAAMKGQLQMVKCLVDRGAEIEKKDHYDCTPLHFAIKNGHFEIVEYLLSHGVDIEALNNQGMRPLHLATKLGCLKTVRCLVSLGADIEAISNDGFIPLHFAAFLGYLKIVKCLVSHMESLEPKENHGEGPLLCAALQGHLEVVVYLLSQGADIELTNVYGATALFLGVEGGNLAVVEYLVSQGANINHLTNIGMSVIRAAISLDKWEVIPALLVYDTYVLTVLPDNVKSFITLALQIKQMRAENITHDPRWTVLDAPNIWLQIQAHPGLLTYEAFHSLEVAYRIVQDPFLLSSLNEAQKTTILTAHPALADTLYQMNHAPSDEKTAPLYAMEIVAKGISETVRQELSFLISQAREKHSLLSLRTSDPLFFNGHELGDIPLEVVAIPESKVSQEAADFMYVSCEKIKLTSESSEQTDVVVEPLFKVIAKPVTAMQLNIKRFLQNLERMSIQELYVGEEKKSLFGLKKKKTFTFLHPSAIDTWREINVGESERTISSMIHLKFCNLSSLKRINVRPHKYVRIFSDSTLQYYIFPRFQEQVFIVMENCHMYETPEGYYILKLHDPESFNLVVGVPSRLESNAIINKNNSESSAYDDVPGIDRIRHYFSNETSCSYQSHEQRAVPCGERAVDFFDHYGASRNAFCAGSSLHAFWVVKQEDGQFARVDFGGTPVELHYQSLGCLDEENELPELQFMRKEEVRINEVDNLESVKSVAFVRVAESEVSISAIKKYYLCGETPALLIKQLLSRFDVNQKNNSFYLDGFNSADTQRDTLKIFDPETVVIESAGHLDDFLNSAWQNPLKNYSIIVRWDTMSANERVRLNSLLDEDYPHVQGQPLSNNVCVYSVLTSLPEEDPSFMRRLGEPMQLNEEESPLPLPRHVESITIDICGVTDWEAMLFGPLEVEGDAVLWKQSAFSRALLSEEYAALGAPAHYVIEHILPEHKKSLEEALTLALARGYWRYHGYDIPFTESMQLTIGKEDFEFDHVDTSFVTVRQEVNYQDRVSGARLINSELFDYLLVGKKIDNGKYYSLPGWIESTSLESEPCLDLYVSEALSDPQWYLLFRQAKQYGVSLHLDLAPGVRCPKGISYLLATAEEEKKEAEEVSEGVLPQVIVTNDAEAVLANCEADDVFDVEDYSYQDLFYKIDYQKTEEGFFSFNMVKSDFLAALQEGRSVILKGEFSEKLLSYLHPILANGHVNVCGEHIPLEGQLILLVEDPAAYTRLEWLPHVSFEEVKEKNNDINFENGMSIIYEEPVSSSLESCDYPLSIDASNHFINRRLDALKDALHDHPWVRLLGEAGVGKSRLLNALESDAGYCVYKELDAFELWASDCGEGKCKVLFIDESNLENKHFTFLSPLQFGGTRRVLYKGKLYVLDEDHKIVFAENPLSYKGGRFVCKLDQLLAKAGHVIPTMRLGDFPPEYIYHGILKPIYENVVSDGLSEEAFQKACIAWMKDDLVFNTRLDPCMTVRSLQEIALSFCVKHSLAKYTISLTTPLLERHGVFASSSMQASSDYIDFLSHQLVSRSLQDFLLVDQYKRDCPALNGLGLNAWIIDGKTGLGKTRLVEHQLKLHGYEEGKDYLRLSVGMSDSAFKLGLKHALDEGKLVWVDEVNALSPEWEKLLNIVLTQSAGRMIMTRNLGLTGRSALSDALLARCHSHELLPPTREDIRHYLSNDLTLDEAYLRGSLDAFIDDVLGCFENDLTYTMKDFREAIESVKKDIPLDPRCAPIAQIS